MRTIGFLLLFAATGSGLAQTTISAGTVYGTWKKTGSPYKINGQITVPKDSTLHIEAGVKVEYQGAYMMHVYGSIQALGKVNDTVTFTPANKSTGWRGMYIHKNKTGADSNLFKWCKIEFVVNIAIVDGRGAISMDTVNNIAFYNTIWQYNSAVKGACIIPLKSDIKFVNCIFRNNQITSNNAAVTNSGGSVMNGALSNLSFEYCQFNYNKSRLYLQSDDSTVGRSTGAFIFGNGKLKMNNCQFYRNHASSYSCLYITTVSSDSIIISNTIFLENYSCGKTVFYFSNLGSLNISLSNLLFKQNFIGRANELSANYPTSLSTALCAGTPKISNCTFINEKGGAYSTFKASSVYLDKVRMHGCDSIALYCGKKTSQILNSLFTNNRLAIYLDGGQILLSNSTISNNGDPKGRNFRIQGGISMSSPGGPCSYSIYNSIIQNNYGNLGIENIIYDNSASVLNIIKNSIIQGGLDSAKSTYGSTKITSSSIINLISDTVHFVNTSAGVGPQFYSSSLDFHLLNSCNYIFQGLNIGSNSITDAVTNININFNGTTDLDGNPRIKCGTIDIGPYELEGSKQSVSIDQEPTDQKVCPKSTVTIAPTACGASINYQWQKSTSSATAGYTNIGSATTLNYAFTPKDSGWYRLIITQAECNKKDTSVAAKISFKPGSSIAIISQPRDTSICANSSYNLMAGIQGSNNTMRWQKSKTSASTGFADISGGNSNPFGQKIVDSSWYRLIIKNSICNYEDTTKVAKINKLPIPTPNLGADQTLAYNSNKVLNPGTFTSYLWSHPVGTPATTPILTVDKSNLIVGANKVWVEVSNSYGCKGRDTINITLQPADGVLDPSTAGIGVYPVPMQNQLQITLPENIQFATYQISNLAGQKLINGVISRSKIVDVTSLPSGSHILNIQAGDKVYGAKVVKSN